MKQIFQIHIPQLTDGNHAVNHFMQGRDDFHLALGRPTHFDDLPDQHAAGGRNGDNNLLNSMLHHNSFNVVTPAQHFDAIQYAAQFFRIIVDETDDFFIGAVMGPKLFHNPGPDIAGAKNQHSLRTPQALKAFIRRKPDRQSYPANHGNIQNTAEDVQTSWHRNSHCLRQQKQG